MAGCVDALRIREMLGDEYFDKLRDKANVIVVHGMEVLFEIPLGKWSDRFRADKNEATVFDEGSEAIAWPIGFPACPVEAK
tara:strand:- start:722 stop:964 length:243 start_codon:yes stop_codon:yes gene_type:complete